MAGKNTVEIILSASDRASGALRQAFGNIENSGNKFTGAMKAGLAVTAGAFTALSGYIAKTGVDYNAMMEQSKVAWTTLLGSQDKAKQQLKDISDFAKSTPFETEQVDTMAKYMFNAGYAGKSLYDQLMKVSDVASAFNIPADSAQELARQMSQVVQAGVAYTEDLNILQDRGVPIFKALAAEMHTNVANVKQMASQGKITSDVYMKAFNDVAKTVKGASDAQSQTFNGMISTFKDDLGILAGALSKPLFEKLKSGMDLLLPTMDSFTSLARGDFKGFSDQIEKTFGKETGGLIVSFSKNIMDGFGVINQYVDKGKEALKGMFDLLKGDTGTGVSILNRLGFSSDTITLIQTYIQNVKDETLGFGKWVTDTFGKLFSGKNNLGSSFGQVFNTIKSVALPILKDIVDFVRDGIKRIKEFWDKDGSKIIQSVKDEIKLLSDVFTLLEPVLSSVWDSVKTVGIVVFNSFMDTVQFLGDKMNWILPILTGVAAAIGAFKIISTITTLINAWREASLLMVAVQKAMTIAQAALNVVMDANPIGLIALAIGALVAAGIALYENWDYVKKKAGELWQKIKEYKDIILLALGPIGLLIDAGIKLYENWTDVELQMGKIWRSIERGAADMVNGIIDGLNWMIQQINKIPGVTIPLIGKVHWGEEYNSNGGKHAATTGRTQAKYASGTDFHPGGFALVGENGPEVMELPTGAKIHSNSDSKKMLGAKQTVYNVTVNAKSADIDEKQLIRYLQRMEALNIG